MAQKIILPLGDASEALINQQINRMVDEYNQTLTSARQTLQRQFLDLPEKVHARLVLELDQSNGKLPVFEIINAGRIATIADAKSVLGEDFIGPEKIGEVFAAKGLDIPTLPDTTELPFQVHFLENLKNSSEGAILMYQPTVNGEAINLETFAKMQQGLNAKPDGDLLYRDQFTKDGTVSKKAWFADEKYSEYRNQQVIKPGWRIATKTVVHGTTRKRVVEQALTVCTFIETICTGMVIPEVLQNTITVFRDKSHHLQQLQDNNPKQFLVEIQETLFWKHCMESGLETLFRLVVCNQVNEEKLLPNVYTRNAVVEPVFASLDYSGYFASAGPGLFAYGARYSFDDLGLGFSWHTA
jgi:hypothetical protein